MVVLDRRTVDHDGRTYPLTLRCNPRARRLILRIDSGGEGAVVTLPRGVAIAEALAFAHAKRDWIARRLDAVPARVPFADGARVARYAAGRDYHNVLGKLLEKLARRLAAEGFGGPWRKIVDAGPLLERSHAARAGLGFESRAANLLHPDFGPWFFLGELLIEEPLVPTEGPLPGSCGTCRACIDACPTGAIFEPGRVHAPDCISYQTIENRGPVPREMRERLGE